MKLSSVTILAAATLFLAGCDSLGNLFHGSRRDTAAAATPAQSANNDTRYWDPQRNQWVAGTAQESSTTSKPKPASTEVAADPPAPAAPTPAPPRAPRATGVYNSSTGKIEWQSGGYIPPAAPTSEATRHWWWPF